MIVFGEAQLRRILGRYAACYNETRLHRFLDNEYLNQITFRTPFFTRKPRSIPYDRVF